MNFDKDGLEDFQERVNEVSAQVKKIASNDFDPKEADEKEIAMLKKQEYKERKKARDVQDHYDKILRGREGKGEKDNYKYWCRKCNVEYTIESPNCFHCSQKNVTREERKVELDEKLVLYKNRKERRNERKYKWEMWKKTKQMFWKKTATDYSKWEYFTDSEDEIEEAEKNAKPIVPENDPQFRAMEKDLNDRTARMKRDRKAANEQKDQANVLMKKKDYFRAIELYTQALDLNKSGKYLWTNRALAYLKFGKYQECEDDCTRILEYSEYLEDGFTKSKDPNFKAFCRRAQAKLEMKKYDEAITDVDLALTLFPGDKGALELKDYINKRKDNDEELKKLDQTIKGFDKDNFDDPKYLHMKAGMVVVDIFLELKKHLNDETKKQAIKEFDYGALVMALGKEMDEKDLGLYFYRKGGFDLIKLIMQKELYTPFARENKYNLFNFLHVVLEENELFQIEAKDCGIIRVAIKNLAKLAEKTFKNTGIPIGDSDKIPDQKENKDPNQAEETPVADQIDYFLNYKTMEEIFEILTCCSMNTKCRIYIREKPHLLVPIFGLITTGLSTKIEDEYELYSSVILLYCNLFIHELDRGHNELKATIIKEHSSLLIKTFGHILRKSNKKYLVIKKTVLSFLSNLFLEKEVRRGALLQLLLEVTTDTQTLMDNCPFAYILQSIGKDLFTMEKNYPSKNPTFNTHFHGYIENLCAMFINMNYALTDEKLKIRFKYWISETKINLSLSRAFVKVLKVKDLIYTQNTAILKRMIMCLSKFDLVDGDECQEAFKTSFPFVLSFFSEKGKEIGLMDEAIKYLAHAYMEKTSEMFLTTITKQVALPSQGFKSALIEVVQDDENNVPRFVNTCTLINSLLDHESEFMVELKMMIGKLINIMKDKTDQVRQSAAATLARLCKNKKNQEVCRDLHGIEVMLQLQQHLIKGIK